MELQRTEMESGDKFDDCHEFSKNFLPTLPPTFGSLLGKSISIESERPQQIIELGCCEWLETIWNENARNVFLYFCRLLGRMLGITDYQINMISFWFLDTLADQVLRHKKNLGEYYTTVLISWLTGEIKLIRGNTHAVDKCIRLLVCMRDTFLWKLTWSIR